MKCLWRALGQLKKRFDVVALGEIRFEYMGALQKGMKGGGSR